MFEGDNKREKVLVLLAMCFALFMAMLDNTVVNVALPTIQRQLGATQSGLQWIVDAYALAFGTLLLTGGTLGDRFGHKRTFLSGLTIFTLASLLSGLSQSTEQLIAFRVLQGVGGALLMPGTLSIITITFPPHERARAIGFWAGVSGLALALGPTMGGWFVEHAGWQSVFFLNVPIGIVGFVVALKVVRAREPHGMRRIDVPGLLFGSSGLFLVVYGLIESSDRGWGDWMIVGSLVLGVTLLVAMLMWERKSDHAMLPLEFFKMPSFSAGNLVAFCVSLGMFTTFFFVSQYLQNVRHFTPFEAGASFLPLTGMITLVAPQAGKLAGRVGSRLPMTAGLSLASSGLFLLSFVSSGTSYLLLAPVFTMMGAGMALTMTPMTAAVMNSVGPKRAGLGGAMTNTSREIGGVFGIALLGSVLATRYDAAIVAGMSKEEAFMVGFHAVVLIAAIILAAAAVITRRYIPAGVPARGPASHEDAGVASIEV